MSDRQPPGPPKRPGPFDPFGPNDDDEDPSDWLASQFDPTGELPKPPVPPAQAPPVQPVQPTQPPMQPVQPASPPPPQFPPQPGTPQQARPQQFPPVAQQPVGQQPVPQQPAQPQQPSVPQQPAPQQPAQPPQQGGFSWGLTPGAPPPAATPPVTPPPSTPPPAPSTPPAAAPPAAVPPAAAQPGAWFESDAPRPPAPQNPAPQNPAPHDPAHHDPAPLDSAIAGTPHEAQPPAAPMPFETGVLPDVAPDSRDAPPFWEPEPTQMMDAIDVPEPPAEQPPRQPFTRSVFPEGTELLPETSAPASAAALGAPAGETGAVSAIDSLFGESQFREYTGIADANENPFVRKPEPRADPTVPGARPPGPPPAVSKLQRILLTVLGSMLAVIALIALFFLGIRLPDLLGPAPAVTAPSASPSPSSSPAIAIGPVAPGTYQWDELLGGECLDPYESPWQDEYTVVDCANPHPAQMVHTAPFPVSADGVDDYPGEEALQTQALALCRAPGIFSAESAAVKDGQVSASYPVSAEDWDAGKRNFYCFVTRSSGEPITGDLTLPQVAPTPAPGG